MEQLLHYVWQHRMFPLGNLLTTDGTLVEVIDPGLHNFGAGPDFFNAKVRIGEQMWVGNVEIHLRASDWYRHHHDRDRAYDNVILHVVGQHDMDVETAGHTLPTLVIAVPDKVQENYRELLSEEAYPPCYRVIPQLAPLMIHSWMSALTVERLETKTERIDNWIRLTDGDWERTFFICLARAFGFGTNADAFERWAATIDLQQAGKHRDDAFQTLAFFLGQAGFLPSETDLFTLSAADTEALTSEYRFLQHKFGLTPLPRSIWKMGRLRPQNSPLVRLSQLAELYHSARLNFSKIRKATDTASLRALLKATTLLSERSYSLSEASLDLLIVNAVAPCLFAYGRSHQDEALCDRAFNLLEAIKPEHNTITRCWARAGITAQHAADSQALIQLRTRYCDRKDCLRCRFGAAYLKKISS